MSFQFGSGQPFEFSSQARQSATPAPAFPSTREQREIVRLRRELARTSAELVDAERVATSASAAERIARSTVAFQQQQQQQQADQHRRAMDDEYSRGVRLELENEELKVKAEEQRSALADTELNLKNTTADLHQQVQAAAAKEKELTGLRESVAKLRGDLDDEKKTTDAVTASLDDAYAALSDTKEELKAAVKAREEAATRELHFQHQANDFHAKLDAAQTHISELEALFDKIQDLEKDNAGLETDIDELRAQIGDHERTLIVKDERISHLETQYQKERQRNLNAEAAAARTAAASPIDEHPEHIFPPFSENLADELIAASAAHSDYDESIYEVLLEHSAITKTINISPIAPVTAPQSKIQLYKAASVMPVEAHRPVLSTAVYPVANFEPIEARQPPLTLHVNPVASVTPIEPVHPQLTMSDIHSSASVAPKEAVCPELTVSAIHPSASVAPIEAARPQLNMSDIHSFASVAPKEAARPELTIAINQVGSVTPIKAVRPELTISAIHSSVSVAPEEAAHPELTVAISQVANIIPVDVAHPQLAMIVNKVASVEPVEAHLPQLTLHINEVGSVTPVEAVRPQLTISAIHSSASVAPREAARPQLVTTINDVANIEPVKARQPQLTLHINEVGSVAPIEAACPQLTISDIHSSASVAPKAAARPELTTTIHDVANIEPVETRRPQLTLYMNEVGNVRPIEAVRPEFTISAINEVARVAPVEPTQQAFTRNIYEAVSVAPTEAIRPALDLSTRDHASVETAEPVRPTLTMHVLEVAQVEPIAPTGGIDPARSPTIVKAVRTPRQTINFAQRILPSLAMALLAMCIYFYMELDAWRTANGVSSGSNSVYTNRGAFGNGRYLFGYIPVAMGVGQSWFEEVIARQLSVAIASIEGWAGTSQRVLF